MSAPARQKTPGVAGLSRLQTGAIIAAAVLIGAALRVPVASQSVLADELSTYWIVSAHDLWGVLTTVHSDAEITPPLSFVAGWLSTRAHMSPELLRLPSLAAGLATIPGVFLLGRRTVGQAAGLLAAAIVAVAPFMVYYSSEARGYALMMAIVTFSTLAMLLAVEEGRTRWWVVYGALSCAAMYTHYTSAFVLLVQLGWLLWTHPEARRSALIANAAAAAAYLPWTTGLVNDLSSPTTEILSAVSDIDGALVSLEHWAIAYPYARIPVSALPGVAAMVALTAAVVLSGAVLSVRAWRRRGLPEHRPRDDHRTLLVLSLALVTPLATAAISIAGTQLFSTRNLAASWPAFALALSALVLSSGPRLRYLTAGLAFLAFAIAGVKMLEPANGRPQYQQAARFVNRHAEPRDVVIDEAVVLSPGPLSPIDIYLRDGLRVLRSGKPQQRSHPFTVFDADVKPATAARRALAATAAGGRIYVVTYDVGVPVARPLRTARLIQTRRYPGLVRLLVRVYQKPA